MKDFDLLEPRSISKLLIWLDQYRRSAKIIAGGTDLLFEMERGVVACPILISLRNISQLSIISFNPKIGLRLGAAVTIHEAETSPIIKENYPLIAHAASQLGMLQVRNQATIGGNLCQASPAGDMIPPLMALGALLKLQSNSGERTVEVEKFFRGHRKTVLKSGEVLKEILVPPPAPNDSHAFLKYSRMGGVDLAIVNVGVRVRLNEDHKCEEACVSLGGVAPTVIRARLSESLIEGKELSDALIQKAGEKVMEEVQPISDIRASSEYRREMSRVMTIRAVKAAIMK
jgi:CO/xanthine dehydrogenase FAD-binding subunit